MESTTKKKLGTAAGSVAAVGAAVCLTAGTFSYFTDTDTGPTQTIATGNIAVEHSFSDVFPNVKWKPGTTYTETYTLTNTGSVSGDLTVELDNAGGDPELINALQVKVGTNAPGTLAQVEGYGAYDAGTLAPGGSRTFTIKVTLPETNTNQNALEDLTASAKVVATLQTS
ncbi:TasA family protein [Spelaeicoccus albus]|uniref:Putative ribosomally synthesized peptide with SipW-like signal peptide n=1 Tax=Spelaeicoccus albus TaxID=1280376 RepID=A0A7Z0IJ88_9MICO|nr:TasA family protein [Spelaeicoccus albus]NYI69172.1 putative ribosomally synthesized peptide with SipW-like signal peptide [Spelaeicoccus albus]